MLISEGEAQASQLEPAPGARIPRGTRGGTVYGSPPQLRGGDDLGGATTNLIIRHFKNTMLGLSQGWSINLELKGIGFTGKIEQQGLRPSPSGDPLGIGDPLGDLSAERAPQSGTSKSASGAKLPTKWGAGVPANRRPASKGGKAPTTCAERALVPASRATGAHVDLARVAPLGGATRGQCPQEANVLALVLTLNLGFSHEVFYQIPQHSVAMRLNVGQGPSTSPNQVPTISIFGISKTKTNQVASDIYRYKKPEPYKGKGIRYDGERFFAKNSENKKG